MNISYNWLRDLVDTKLAPRELAQRLTFAGLAVEAVHQAGDDYVLELDITSNRGDCLSHLGIAREVSAIEQAQLRIPHSAFRNQAGRAEDFAAVQIWDADLCPRYAARIIRGVKIAPSPEWMIKRLEAIGQRPLNNVADITNYVLFELGQPLHAFDLATLKGPEIIVRRATPGEKMKTLDGTERTFDSEMLLICDAERAVAIGGVMGGLETEITDSTTDVLLEAAYFTPAGIRRTSRLLGLSTEASKRFERGTDPANVLRAQERAAELICELAGGVMTENALDVYPQPPRPVVLGVRPERVKTLTGLDVPPTEMTRILVALGFTLKNEAETIRNPQSAIRIQGVVPSWRHDMEREEDLVEEVARLAGYDNIPAALPPATSAGEYQPNEVRRRALRQALAACGYDEAIKFSFIDEAHDKRFDLLPVFATTENAETKFVTLLNSIIEEWPRMRPTLLPGLLDAVRHNLNHGTRDVRLFELGRVFAAQAGQELPLERESCALVATGNIVQEEKAGPTEAVDFYDLKGALETLRAALGLPALLFEACSVKHLREGQAALIRLPEGSVIGSAGRLNDEISAVYKFRQAVYLAELDLAALLHAKTLNVRYTPLPRHPAVVRDLSLLVARRVTWAELQQTIAGMGLLYCRRVQLVDVYEGVNIPEGQRSITLRLEYRAWERTLRDEDVEIEHTRVVEALAERYSAQQRA